MKIPFKAVLYSFCLIAIHRCTAETILGEGTEYLGPKFESNNSTSSVSTQQSNPEIRGMKIVLGGLNVTSPYLFPFFGQVWKHEKYVCGCSLIRSNVVVLAAHCIQGSDLSNYRVLFGSTRASVGMSIPVVFELKHPLYVNKNFTHDISLLKLARPVHFSAMVKTIRLSKTVQPYNKVITAIGFGASESTLDQETKNVERLTMTMLPIRSSSECSQNDDMKYYDPKSQFCAGYKDTAGISLCWGDSGGPAFVLQNGDWELVGVTSWSNYCGFPNEFSYFTDVQKLHNWIECEAWKLQQL